MKQIKITKAKPLFFALFLFSSFSLFSNDALSSSNEDEETSELYLDDSDELFLTPDEDILSAMIDKMSTALSPTLIDITKKFNETAQQLAEFTVYFGEVLKAEKLCNPVHILFSKTFLTNFANKVNQCERLFKNELALAHVKLKNSYKNEAVFLMATKLGLDTYSKPFLDYFEVEREVVTKSDAILNLLSSIEGKFWESNKKLNFENATDETKYNLLIEQLKDHVKKEAVIVKRLQRES